MAEKRYTATVEEVYIDETENPDGDNFKKTFYHIDKILKPEDIISYNLSNETKEQVFAHYAGEELWIADYNNEYPDLKEKDKISFSVQSSRYYPNMNHRNRTKPFSARNILVSGLKKEE